MAELTIEEKAEKIANALGISLYIREGKIYQHGPGLEIIPPASAQVAPHGALEPKTAE